MNELIKLYNPANSDALTSEQVEAMQHLTTDEIKMLARAFPNTAFQNAYLLIIDKNVDIRKQPPTATSWENLYNLHSRHGLTNWVAYNYRRNIKRVALIPEPIGEVGPVLDLSDTELISLPGFKTAPTTDRNELFDFDRKIELKKIRKTKKQKDA